MITTRTSVSYLGGELGHGLGALRHGVLGELTGHQADGGLDLGDDRVALLL